MPDPAAAEPRLVLCDLRDDVVDAWRSQFALHPEVEIRRGDIFAAGTEALLLPGNAFGYLDRGLELAVCERFGWDVQEALREQIHRRFHGELLVGQAAEVAVSGPFQRIIYACVYRTPKPLAESLNAYLAVRGALLLAREADRPAPASIATAGVGIRAGLHPATSARQVRYAWEITSGRRALDEKNLSQLARRESKLCSIPLAPPGKKQSNAGRGEARAAASD